MKDVKCVSEKFEKLKDFFSYAKDQNDYSMDYIVMILDSSAFIIEKNKKNYKFLCNALFKDKIIDYNEILDIKDRALFRIKMDSNIKENKEQYLNKFHSFEKIVTNIKDLISCLNMLTSQWSTINEKYFIRISSKLEEEEKEKVIQDFVENNSNYKEKTKDFYYINLLNLESELKKKEGEKGEIEKTILDIYKNSQIMTMISGRQFSEFSKFLENKEMSRKVIHYINSFIKEDILSFDSLKKFKKVYK